MLVDLARPGAVATALLAVGKVTGVITWSWWWVASPYPVLVAVTLLWLGAWALAARL